MVADASRAREEAQLCLRPAGGGRVVASGNVPAQNVLVRITVPRRTGRRRRKGSTGPFRFPEEETAAGETDDARRGEGARRDGAADRMDARALVRSLRDNRTAYTVHALGTVAQVHRFRDLPDFVFSTRHSPFMAKVRRHVAPRTYDAVRGFALDRRRGARPDEDLVPPPVFSSIGVPFPYNYKQNPGVVRTQDAATGAVTLVPPARPKIRVQRIALDSAAVPRAPDPALPPIESLSPTAQNLIAWIRERLAERPIWSRRALGNVYASPTWEFQGRRALQYVAYEFRSGPWRDLAVRFGVDPRADPAYRVYQSMVFQFDAEVRNRGAPAGGGTAREGRRRTKKLDADPRRRATPRGHVFDGTAVGLDGKMWQVCDIEEPVARRILATENLRTTCHVRPWPPSRTLVSRKRAPRLTKPPAPQRRLVPQRHVGESEAAHAAQDARAAGRRRGGPRARRRLRRARRAAGRPPARLRRRARHARAARQSAGLRAGHQHPQPGPHEHAGAGADGRGCGR